MSKKIRCVLVEDNPIQLRLLKLCCEEHLESYCEVVATYTSAEKFMDEHKKLSFDLLLLDIDLGEMKGTDIARLVNKPVIFVTGRNEYAPEVLKLQFQQDNIVTQITKPVDKSNLEHAFKKFLLSQSKSPTILLSTNQGERNILVDDILLITTKATGFKKGVLLRYDIEEENFHARNKILVTAKEVLQLNGVDFDYLTTRLPAADFHEISKSILVSKKAIKGYTSEGLTFVDTLKGYISEAYFNVSNKHAKEFKEWLRK